MSVAAKSRFGARGYAFIARICQRWQAGGTTTTRSHRIRNMVMSKFLRAMRRLGNGVMQSFGQDSPSRDRRCRRIMRRPIAECLESRQLLTAVYPEIDIRGNGQSIANND